MAMTMSSSSVTLPRFVSASTAGEGTSVALGEGDDMFSSLMNGDADFDLLAEYLLEDSGGAGGSAFGGGNAVLDIGNTPSANATTVSVGASSNSDMEGLDADPLADAAAAAAAGSDVKTNGVSDLAMNLQQIQSMFANKKGQGSASTDNKKANVKPQSKNAVPNATTSLSATSGKRKHAETSAEVMPATIPMISAVRTSVNSSAVNNNRSQRQKSQAQIDRRRERNRILARRTRLRKKFFFESLQKEVTDLQRENTILKEIVRSKIRPPAKAMEVLEECKSKDEIPSIVFENVLGSNDIDKQDFSLVQSLQGSQQCFLITDPSLQDNPIVYASGGFLSLTGYTREEVLGRNCRFLQGKDTSPQKIEKLKKAVSLGQDVGVCLVNYTSDGTPFWNQVFIAALRDAHNNIVNFVGVLSKVSGPAPDDPEHGKLLNIHRSESKVDMDDMVQIAVEAADAVTGTLG